jgi:protein-S-isoprenylcysteine O-methyltransferase Ste14
MSRILAITNASKANIVAAVNAALSLLLVFGVSITDAQVAAIVVAVNAVLVLLVGATYQNSAKRIPDGSVAVDVPPPPVEPPA